MARSPAPTHDERLDDASTVLVGRRHDGALDDGRVLDEDALDLEGPDAVARQK